MKETKQERKRKGGGQRKEGEGRKKRERGKENFVKNHGANGSMTERQNATCVH